MSAERYFDMPTAAVHTSGLAWDGEHLWAVDYISNCAYWIDLEASLAAGTALMSERSRAPVEVSPVVTSTEAIPFIRVEIGFIAVRTTTVSPFVMPPSIPPA